MRLQSGTILVAAIVLIALAGAGAAGFKLSQRDTAPAGAPTQRADIGGPIALTSYNGTPFTNADLKGKPFAIFFGFTRCPNVCPTTLSDLTADLAALGPLADRLQVLFVSIDPERDTPQSMKDYLSAFDPRIIGLTGSLADVAKVAKAYRVFYEKVPTSGGDYTMNHSASIYLMAGDGSFTSTISFEEQQADRVAKLKRLAEGGSAST